MAVNLSPVGGVAAQFFDNSGNVLTGGKIYTYTAGTTTNQATYTSAAGVTAHSNPIILDASGRVPGGEIWLTDGLSYKFLIKTSTEILIGSYDNIIGINSNFINFLTETEIQTATAGQTVFTLTTMQYQPGTNSLSVFVDGVNQYDGVTYAYVETDATTVTFTAGLHVGALVKFTTAQTLSSGVTDASLVTYDPAGVGSVNTTVQAKLRETVSVKDFGAVGDGVTDDTAAIQVAIVSNRSVYFPAGIYLINSAINFSSLFNFALIGQGNSAVIIKCNAASVFGSAPLFFQTCNEFEITNITFDENDNASLTNNYAVIRFVSCTEFSFSNNRILNHTYIGLLVDSCTKFTVLNNNILKSVEAATLNYNINISSSLSVSEFGRIENNVSQNSGIGVVGRNIIISNNSCQRTQYGACIATFAVGAAGTTLGEFYGRYVVQSNECFGANGTDIDGFLCSGMEIAGPQSLIQNNSVYGNDGEGIRLFAYQSICSGNIVYNNGQGLGGTFYQGGIVAYFSVASLIYSANFSLIENNKCFDTGGGTQLYGYAEQSTSLTGIQVTGNNFDNNATAPWFLAFTTGNSYDLDYWFSYTPVIGASSGSLTAGTCTGQYMQKGKSIFFQASCAITNNGTGTGSIEITLPKTSSSTLGRYIVSGRANTISGKLLAGVIIQNSSIVTISNYDASYPGATGETIIISGWYAI